MSETSSETEPRRLRRVVAASVIGATIEWYDFFLYGITAGLVFNTQYFPGTNPVVNTMLAYATFAVGFVARPIGGLIFGHFGDRVGRKSMLIITLTLMGLATFAIGLLPNFAAIGLWAPILLLLLRVGQGLAVGGEWGGAVLMTFESGPEHRRGFYGSLPQVGLAIGLCLGAGVTGLLSFLLSNADFLAWGWRIAFLLSGILIFTGLYIRLKVMESPEFVRAKARSGTERLPFVTLIKRYPKNIILGMGARYVDGVVFNVFAVFAISYLTATRHIPRTDVLSSVFVAALVMVFFIPIFGALSDRLGRRMVYGVAAIVCGLASFVTFGIFNATVTLPWVWLAIIIPFGIFYAGVYGPEAALFCELFDTDVRYSGVSFVYQFSGIFASGLTPLIATALLSLGGGSPWLICVYTLCVGVISAISVYFMQEVVKTRRAQGANPSSGRAGAVVGHY